jgi:transposase
MLNNRVAHGSPMRTVRWRQQLEELPLLGVDAIQREHSLRLIDELKTRIAALEIELERRGAGDGQIALLETHPGVGLLTALAVFSYASAYRSIQPGTLCCGILRIGSSGTVERRYRSIWTHFQAR